MNYRLYADNFKKRRPDVLRAANNCCIRCGVQNRTLIFLPNGDPHIIYLHCAHVFENQREDPTAPLIALCPSCHWHYDHPRSRETPEGQEDWAFIGLVAQRFIEQNAKWLAEQENT